MTTLLDPTDERAPTTRPRAPRLESIAGKTLGLLDISKPQGDLFLDRLEARLRDLGARIERFRKPTFTRPAPVEQLQTLAARCDGVIEALAD